MSKGVYNYTDEKNAQIVIALLKAHGIRKIVANPGIANLAFVGSVQNDPWFTVYSGVDERHSAYLACGIAAESGEAVVLSCTGATSSRNYLPALTEAYYRKLPILAVTSSHPFNLNGNLWPQMIDRTSLPKDAVKYSIQCPVPNTKKEEDNCVSNVNKAIMELFRHGGGPVHINLETYRLETFNTKTLPVCRVIKRVDAFTKSWPVIPDGQKIAIWIGAHRTFTNDETEAIEKFVASHNAVVLVDRTSGYAGKYAIQSALVCSQKGLWSRYPNLKPELVIHLGEVSGDYPTMKVSGRGLEVWRVNIDGEARDLWNKLTFVFEMPEAYFFSHYQAKSLATSSYLNAWREVDKVVRNGMPELPFSNFWMANQLHDRIPTGSVLHLGILNSLRAWNLFENNKGILCNCNVGGFGIDGCMSSIIGASLVCPDKLYYLIIGDLAFFYDLNALGNRYIGKNLRILLVNNGCGAEFNLYSNRASQFGEHTNDYIAAGGHNGRQSRDLVRHFAQDLGFLYLSASDKNEFMAQMNSFISIEADRSIIFECFTSKDKESEAAYMIDNIMSPEISATNKLKGSVKSMIPSKVKNVMREILK